MAKAKKSKSSKSTKKKTVKAKKPAKKAAKPKKKPAKKAVKKTVKAKKPAKKASKKRTKPMLIDIPKPPAGCNGECKKALCVSASVFALIALAHLLRLVFGTSIAIDGLYMPRMGSVIAVIIAGYLAVWMHRVSKY